MSIESEITKRFQQELQLLGIDDLDSEVLTLLDNIHESTKLQRAMYLTLCIE